MNTGTPNLEYSGPERRRSKRLAWDVGLIVRMDLPGEENFQERTFTISVSAHGALVLLAAKVEMGQKLFLLNPLTGCEVEGRVVRFGSPHGGLASVVVEFLEPSAQFWPFPEKERP